MSVEKAGNGAVIGGWICFVLGMLAALIPLPTWYLYLPLFLVSFILAIVALAQKRTGHGLALLLSTLLAGPIAVLVGMAMFAAIFGAALSEAQKRSQAKALATNAVAVAAASEFKAQERPAFAASTYEWVWDGDRQNYYIVGYVTNLSARTLSSVRISFQLFNKDDVRLGTAFDSIQDLRPMDAWKFSAMVTESRAVKSSAGEIEARF